MLLKVFAVFDKKAEAFLAPFTYAQQGQAMRTFSHTVNDSSTMLYRNPEDFDLFELGTFDDNSGLLSPDKHFLIGAVSVTMETGPRDGDADGNSAID